MGIMSGKRGRLQESHQDASQISFRALKETKFQPVNLEYLKKLSPDETSEKRRAAPRFHLELTAILSNGYKTFRTKTVDVSFTGILLKDVVPEDFVQSIIEIVIKDESEKNKVRYFHFRGRMINEGPSRTRRLSFQAMTKESEKHLLEILDDLTVA